MTHPLSNPRFPRSSVYNPEWVIASASGGANPLWLTEWLTEVVPLQSGMRVLDLGCGRALSSIFLHREFGVQVWATDLWFSASENFRRICDAGVAEQVFPIHADARALPFANEFFDVIVSIDSYTYYGTDDLYLGYLSRFLKPGGVLALAGAGLMQELTEPVPEHLAGWWELEMWSLHSPEWWRRHWDKTGAIQVETADTLADGWRYWLNWHRAICPDNKAEIDALKADRGKWLGYVRVTGRRTNRSVAEPIQAIPAAYVSAPMLNVSG